MQCHVLYFARLREVFGRDNETIGLDKPLPTVADLIALLCQREGVWPLSCRQASPFGWLSIRRWLAVTLR